VTDDGLDARRRILVPVPVAETLVARLGPELGTLVEAAGAPVVHVIPVTTVRSATSPRAAFRVTLADGRVLKARRLATRADAERVARLSPLLDPRHFPPVLARRGATLLTPWVPGRPLAPRDGTPALLRRCGRLQGDLHRLPVSRGIAHLRQRPHDWAGRLDELLGELVAHQALDVRDAREVCRLAAVHAPRAASARVCHTDLGPDNVVLSDAGRVCVVDTEGLSVDAGEYDLARTWYRWPMTPSQQRAYADGYGAHGHGAAFAAHFLHWALQAVTESAAFRVRRRAPGARAALACLAALLRTHGRGEAFPRLLDRA
jgi:hypothetical protein